MGTKPNESPPLSEDPGAAVTAGASAEVLDFASGKESTALDSDGVRDDDAALIDDPDINTHGSER